MADGKDIDMKRIPIPVVHAGDIVTLKKKHPCGAFEFRVMRAGSDVRIVCLGCGRDMTLPREKLEHAIRKISPATSGGEKEE